MLRTGCQFRGSEKKKKVSCWNKKEIIHVSNGSHKSPYQLHKTPKEATARRNRGRMRAGEKKRHINYIQGKGENSEVMEDKKTTKIWVHMRRERTI